MKTKEDRIKNFKKLKRRFAKKYPGVHTKKDEYGLFYVADGNGYRLIPDEYTVPNVKTVLEAWENVEFMLKVDTMLEKNRKRFSDEKVMRKYHNVG